MKSRFVSIRESKANEPTQAELRRAKDFWSDVFHDSIIAQIDDTSAGHAKATDIAAFAGDVADAALAEAEKRWHKI